MQQIKTMFEYHIEIFSLKQFWHSKVRFLFSSHSIHTILLFTTSVARDTTGNTKFLTMFSEVFSKKFLFWRIHKPFFEGGGGTGLKFFTE
jgi:hypothetical protein